MSRAAKQYLREVKKRIPCSPAQKKQFLCQLDNEVFLYCEEHNDIDMAALVDQFGSPEELASDFLPEININTVNGFVQTKHRLLMLLAIIVIAVVALASGIGIYTLYRQQQLLDGQYIESITYDSDVTPYISGHTFPLE